MKRVKFILSIVFTCAISTICIIGINGCTSDGGGTIDVPEFEEIRPPPIEVTIDQLYADYLANEVSANAKYRDGKLLFYDIEVEEVVGNYFMMSEALGAASGDLTYVKLHFYSGVAKFKLREEYFGIMQNIEEGYVLNIIGECEGLKEGFLVIDDCWVESVIGDLGADKELDFY